MITVKTTSPMPEIVVTMDHSEAVRLNKQLEDLEDKWDDATRKLYLALDPVLNKARNGG